MFSTVIVIRLIMSGIIYIIGRYIFISIINKVEWGNKRIVSKEEYKNISIQ